MEGREMPAGWEISTLGEVAGKGQYGWTTKASTCGSVKLLRTTDITKGPVNWETVPFCQENPDEIDKYVLSPGDIVVSRAGSVGFASLIGEVPVLCVFASYLIRFTPNTLAIIPRYLNRFLHSPEYWNAISGASAGIALANVNASKLSLIRVPLAPLSEQRRIAAKLDTTIAAVEACRQRLDGVAAILKRFRQAVLAAATSGELTREWREENGHNHGEWAFRRIDEIASEVFDGPFGSNLKSDDYTADGYRVVRLENLLPLRFLEEKRTYVSHDKFSSLSRHILYESDILFSSFIDEEVRTCLLPEALSGRSINKADCFCVRVERKVCRPEFVVAALSCRSTFDSLAGQVHGATRPRINLKQLKAFTLRIPPLDEQDNIVQRIQELFTLADQLEVKLSSSLKIVECLTPSLLAKAFLGELVPQDPSDEPASELLAKLKSTQSDALHVSPRRRAKQPTLRQTMSISDKDSIKEVILSLESDRFSFDELRDQAGGDYESLKGILFELLEEQNPVVRQFFDKEVKAMKLERIRP